MRRNLSLILVLVVCGVTAAQRPEKPILIAKPEAFQTLVPIAGSRGTAVKRICGRTTAYSAGCRFRPMVTSMTVPSPCAFS